MPFTRWLLEADDATLSRGRAYAREGRVSVVRRTSAEVTALVEGTTSYDVTVGEHETFCTCPIGMRGQLCKHVVAVVLTEDDGESAQTLPVTAQEQTAGDPDVEDPDDLEELVSSLRVHGHPDWREANQHGEHAHAVADRFEALLTRARADEVRGAVETAVTTMVRAILRSDDSSGIQGDATARMLDVHARAATLGSPDPVRLARWLAKVSFARDSFLDIDPVPYAEALGDLGLAAYAREIDKVLAAHPGQWSATRARQRLAVLSGDVDRIVETVGGPLSTPFHHEQLVSALLEVGADDAALRYARAGITLAGSTHYSSNRLVDVAVRLLQERDLPAEAVAVRIEHLRSAPELSTFLALRRTATEAGSWPDSRLDALDALLARRPDDWLRALLVDGDADLAWEASRTMTLDRSVGLQLVRARAKTHPADVHSDYVRIVDETLVDSRMDNYSEAVKLLGELRRADEACGAVTSYDDYVTVLLERHRRRPRLVEKLRAMPPARAR